MAKGKQYKLTIEQATSAADTLTEAEILLDQMEVGKVHKQNGRIKLPVIDAIWLWIDAFAHATTHAFRFMITSQQKGTTEVEIDDSNCVYKWEMDMEDDGTPAVCHENVFPIECPIPPGGIIYTKNKFWLGVDTDNVSAVRTFRLVLWYHYEWFHPSEVQKLMEMLD